MLKILQARLQQYVNRDLPDVQVVFRKDSGTRDQIAYIHWTIKKGRDFQKKNIYLCFIDYTKAFDYVNHSKLWKILKEMGTSRPKRNMKRYTFQGPRTIFLGSLEHVV